MSLMFIRVLAGFLAGLAAGILMMRIAYKKKELVATDSTNTNETVVSNRAS